MVLFPLLSRTGVNWILVTKLTTFRSGNSAGDEKETTNILDEFRARHRCNFQQVGSRERERQHIFYLFHHWTKSRLFVLLDVKYIYVFFSVPLTGTFRSTSLRLKLPNLEIIYSTVVQPPFLKLNIS